MGIRMIRNYSQHIIESHNTCMETYGHLNREVATKNGIKIKELSLISALS